MKTIEQIARKINGKIKEWAKQHDKLVVIIDGYAGSGKTAVADRLAELNPDCLVVHLDDFIKHWRLRKRMMDTAKDPSKVFEYRWYRYDAVERLVRRFMSAMTGHIRLKVYDFDKNEFSAPQTFDLSKSILVIDGIFLLHPQHKRNVLWHKHVFLKADFEKADARRIAQEKKRWGKAYLPEDHPDSYFRYFRIAYQRYVDQYRPEQRADLVIDVDGE